MIDTELVNRKLVMIAEDLARIEPLAARSRDAYLASETDETLAERYLERMIGRMLDVNFHLVVESGEAPPRDYFDSFLALGRLRVLTPELARQLAPCAGLRNRIAHEYDALDPGLVHEALAKAVTDVRDYLAAIRTHLATR